MSTILKALRRLEEEDDKQNLPIPDPGAPTSDDLRDRIFAEEAAAQALPLDPSTQGHRRQRLVLAGIAVAAVVGIGLGFNSFFGEADRDDLGNEVVSLPRAPVNPEASSGEPSAPVAVVPPLPVVSAPLSAEETTAQLLLADDGRSAAPPIPAPSAANSPDPESSSARGSSAAPSSGSPLGSSLVIAPSSASSPSSPSPPSLPSSASDGSNASVSANAAPSAPSLEAAAVIPTPAAAESIRHQAAAPVRPASSDSDPRPSRSQPSSSRGAVAMKASPTPPRAMTSGSPPSRVAASPSRPAIDEPLQSPDPTVERVDHRGLPDVVVLRTSWHPTPDRRTAKIRVVETDERLTLREGDAFGGLVVKEILPSSVLFQTGDVEIRRMVGAAR